MSTLGGGFGIDDTMDDMVDLTGEGTPVPPDGTVCAYGVKCKSLVTATPYGCRALLPCEHDPCDAWAHSRCHTYWGVEGKNGKRGRKHTECPTHAGWDYQPSPFPSLSLSHSQDTRELMRAR